MKKSPLKITVEIPSEFVPLVRGYAALNSLTPKKFAQRAVLKYCTGDECAEAMDNVINTALKDV